jgi:hypothetical protein
VNRTQNQLTEELDLVVVLLCHSEGDWQESLSDSVVKHALTVGSVLVQSLVDDT